MVDKELYINLDFFSSHLTRSLQSPGLPGARALHLHLFPLPDHLTVQPQGNGQTAQGQHESQAWDPCLANLSIKLSPSHILILMPVFLDTTF